MKTFLLVIFAFLICLLPKTAFAWDDAGHKVVAYIAWENMTPEARTKAIEILLAAPEDSGLAWLLPTDGRSFETRRREFFEIASTWSDIVRDNKSPNRRTKYHKGEWHYTNYFWKQVNGLPVEVAELKPAQTNVVERLFFLQNAMTNEGTNPKDKAIYLAWILHLVGDIHQPLHTSARVTDTEPRGDQGANLFYLEPKKEITEGSREFRMNLHAYWDGILRYGFKRGDECDGDYIETIGAKLIKNYPQKNFANMMKQGRFDGWAQEGFTAAQKEVYPATLKRDEMPSKKYEQTAVKISERAMALAGYRLAQMLNEILK